jgi:sterol desaturase/sphingolipid hydroxylase (fatty acid hydroxylase superfamily)
MSADTVNPESFLLEHEPTIRLGFFIGVFAAMAVWEIIAPRRALTVSKLWRWASNLGLVVLNTVILRLLFPAAAVGFAAAASAQGFGAFNLLDWPPVVEFVLAVLALDFAIYLQHVMFHAVPLLWRLHRVHHADLDFDVTTGARFHPVEIILSMLIKFAVIAALGPSAAAVLVFEVLLNATAMFNHGNVRLPAQLDALLRLLVVTPDMHRVHHSVRAHETNSNFGFNLPWWDRLFGTYQAQPEAGHVQMTIGVSEPREERVVDRLPGMLAMPLRGRVGDYAINRRQWNEARGKQA